MNEFRIREIAAARGVDYAMQVAKACQNRRLIRLVEGLKAEASRCFPLLRATPAMCAALARRRRSGSPVRSLYPHGSRRYRVIVQTAAERGISALSGRALSAMSMMKPVRLVSSLTDVEIAARKTALYAARAA